MKMHQSHQFLSSNSLNTIPSTREWDGAKRVRRKEFLGSMCDQRTKMLLHQFTVSVKPCPCFGYSIFYFLLLAKCINDCSGKCVSIFVFDTSQLVRLKSKGYIKINKILYLCISMCNFNMRLLRKEIKVEEGTEKR